MQQIVALARLKKSVYKISAALTRLDCLTVAIGPASVRVRARVRFRVGPTG